MVLASTSKKATNVRYAFWVAGLERGCIFGVVGGCHLLALLLLLSYWPARNSASSIPRADSSAMHLRMVVLTLPASKLSSALPTAAPPPRQQRSHPPRVSAPIPVNQAKPIASAAPLRLEPASPDAAPAALVYQHGDFFSRLQRAQKPTQLRLPGSDAPIVAGISLQAQSSPKQLVRALSVSTRCAAERYKMSTRKNEFITAQLRDRALEADGCGAH